VCAEVNDEAKGFETHTHRDEETRDKETKKKKGLGVEAFKGRERSAGRRQLRTGGGQEDRRT
jgi:hypothetical protein